MIEITKTKKGITIESTDTCYGMLVQGGIAGVKKFWSYEDLRKLKINPDKIDKPINDDSPYMWAEYLIDHREPTRLLSRGHKIL